jgi:hypothetical protein
MDIITYIKSNFKVFRGKNDGGDDLFDFHLFPSSDEQIILQTENKTLKEKLAEIEDRLAVIETMYYREVITVESGGDADE